MNREFEKMDSEMMEIFKPARNQAMPEGLLKNFSARVESKILKGNIRAGLGGGGLAAWGFAFFILAVVLWRVLPAQGPAAVPVPVIVLESPALRVPPGAKQSPVPHDVSAPATETEILSDIEALKELGVWTEEDEEKIGILAEERFSELELAFEDNSQFPGPAMAAR